MKSISKTDVRIHIVAMYLSEWQGYSDVTINKSAVKYRSDF